METQLNRKDEELRKANDSRDNIMKTMREALEVAKANKAEYEIKLATVREQCRQEMQREMEEQMRRAKRDFQRQLDEKDKSLEEIKIQKESVVKSQAADSNSECSNSVRPQVELFVLCTALFGREKSRSCCAEKSL